MSEGGLEPPRRGNFPGSGKSSCRQNTGQRAAHAEDIPTIPMSSAGAAGDAPGPGAGCQSSAYIGRMTACGQAGHCPIMGSVSKSAQYPLWHSGPGWWAGGRRACNGLSEPIRKVLAWRLSGCRRTGRRSIGQPRQHFSHVLDQCIKRPGGISGSALDIIAVNRSRDERRANRDRIRCGRPVPQAGIDLLHDPGRIHDPPAR